MFQAKCYSRAGKNRNDSVVLEDGNVGEVRKFVQVTKDEVTEHLALVDVYSEPHHIEMPERSQRLGATLDYIRVVKNVR